MYSSSSTTMLLLYYTDMFIQSTVYDAQNSPTSQAPIYHTMHHVGFFFSMKKRKKALLARSFFFWFTTLYTTVVYIYIPGIYINHPVTRRWNDYEYD